MSVSGGNKITAPVSVQDVRSVLGETSTDVGTLCRSSKINKYSKYKPYNFGGLVVLTDERMRTGNFGMTPTFVQFGGAVSDNKAPVWAQWVLPKGGASEPYRLADFNGYNHTNKAEFVKGIEMFNSDGAGNTTPIVKRTTSDTNIGFYYGAVSLDFDALLTLADFHANATDWLSDMHLTLVIGEWVTTPENNVAIAQSELPLKDILTSRTTLWRVEMCTTDLLPDITQLSTRSIVAIGLAPKGLKAPITNSSLVALNMWSGNDFQHVIARTSNAWATGTSAITYIEFKCSIASGLGSETSNFVPRVDMQWNGGSGVEVRFNDEIIALNLTATTRDTKNPVPNIMQNLDIYAVAIVDVTDQYGTMESFTIRLDLDNATASYGASGLPAKYGSSSRIYTLENYWVTRGTYRYTVRYEIRATDIIGNVYKLASISDFDTTHKRTSQEATGSFVVS